jgi:LacI family transcriptional regulator
VLASIEKLDYHPNPMARGLSKGYTDTVLVILPHIAEPSVAMRLSGLVDVLRLSPYELHLVDLERPAEERIHAIGEIVLRNRPAGVIIISLTPDGTDHRDFRAAGVPVVLVDAPSPEFPTDTVDDVAGGRMATEHLLGLGHERVGFIGDSEATTIGVPASADRRHGYLQALEAAGIPARSEYIMTAPHGLESGRSLGDAMMRLDDPPTAIFAASDLQAIGAVAAARDRGLAVPGDLSVMGYDDIQSAALVGLSTVRQPLEISGRRAGLRILQSLGQETELEMPEFPPLEIVVRETTAPPRATSTGSSTSSPEDVDVAIGVSNSSSTGN